uniref:Signal peptide peptidase-like 2 n=1 Tax=Tanacetum cinerariifolium TaxID=118510 RepID=A0A699I9B2_TANCI|nr:signal peptide peptidase-like 2 [Tanacetum cinerariifolium]
MIEPNEKTQADNKKDKTAIAFLYQALPEEQLLQITKHKTAKVIWDALKTRHIGEERVQQARLKHSNHFEILHMKKDEIIDTLTTKLTTLVNKAASLRHTMEDGTLVCKLLNAVPDSAGDIVHDDKFAPKKPGCENDFVLVKVQTWFNGVEGLEFVGVGARFGTTIVSKEKNANQTCLTQSDPRDCRCKFTTKVNIAQAAGASAVLIINNQIEL